MAGTGKTYLLGVARRVWEQQGFHVLGTSLAATAAKRLEGGSGIASTHLHKLLADLKGDKKLLSPTTVLVVDEAGMIGTKQMLELIALTERAGSKLVLVGDYRQLQSIEAGSIFRGIAKRTGCFELKDIIRQREKWARKSVHELAAGNAESALLRYAKRGLLHIAADREQAMEKLVTDWAQYSQGNLEDTQIFVGTNLDRIMLNRLCQRARLLAGELSKVFISVGSETIRAGDRVLFTKNNALLFIQNGAIGTVTEVLTDCDTLRIQLDDGFKINIETKSYDHLDLGYAVTTHKGQGQSVEQSFVLTGGPMTDREISYVQGSRAKGVTRFYTDILSGGENIEALAKQMERSRAKRLAHDYL